MASSLLTRLKTSSVEATALAAAERRAALAPDVIDACAFFETCPEGRPQLTGAAAQAWAAYTGTVIDPRAGLAGVGALGALDGQIETAEELVQIARELRGDVPSPEVEAQAAAIAHPASILPPDAPTVAPAEKTVRRRTKVEVIPDATAPAPPAPPPAPGPGSNEQLARPEGGLWVTSSAPTTAPAVVVMVNVSLSHALGQPLRRWVGDLLEVVRSTLGLTTDPRLATEGPAAYGRWAVLVEAVAHDVPPAAGLWVVDCHDGDQLTEAALRGLSRRDDVLVIRGR